MSKEYSLVIDTRHATHVFTYASQEDAEKVFDEVSKDLKLYSHFVFTDERLYVSCEGVLSMYIARCAKSGVSE